MPSVNLSSTDRFALGLKYKMDIHLTKLVPKDQAGKAMTVEKLFNDYLKVAYVDAGGFVVQLLDNRLNREILYPIRSSFGNKLGTTVKDTDTSVSVETKTRTVTSRGRTEDIDVHIINETNIDARIANISQHGTVVPS
jgi:hypothetical protein